MRHVGIIVTEVEPQRKFYTDILGFREIWRGSSKGDVLSWTNMKVPDGEDDVEFMLYKEPPDPTRRGSAHILQSLRSGWHAHGVDGTGYCEREAGGVVGCAAAEVRYTQARLPDLRVTRIRR